MSSFESHGLTGGVWSGRYRSDQPPGRIALVHQGQVIALATVESHAEGGWTVEVAVPGAAISEGVQSLILIADRAEGHETPLPDAVHLDRLNLMAGGLLDEDVQAEIAMLRAELELLKREFRRLGTAG